MASRALLTVAALLKIAVFSHSASAQADHPAAEPEAKVVRFASLDWGPYVGHSLPSDGFAESVVRAAFEANGYRVEIVYLPWARALHETRRGKFAGVFPMYFSKRREKDFAFSQAFPGGPVGFYKRKVGKIAFAVDPSESMQAALASIAKWRIGVVRGYLNTKAIDAAEFLHKEEATNDVANMRKLLHGRVDLVFIDFRVAEYLLRSEFSDRADLLEPMLPVLENKLLYVGFSRSSGRFAQLRSMFNEGLEQLRRSGDLQKIRTESGFTD